MEILFMAQNVIYLSKCLQNNKSNIYWTVIGCYCSRLLLRRTRLIELFSLLCLTIFLAHPVNMQLLKFQSHLLIVPVFGSGYINMRTLSSPNELTLNNYEMSLVYSLF